jgi:amidase
VATWITRLDPEPTAGGPRLAVKDAIDVAGVPTTVGCAAIADDAQPAAVDAPCVARARERGARIVGKANLHELCFGTTGVNPWFGTPVNPLDPSRVPGGSSSGSAVAVATGEADIAYGTDTGGSVRIPAACCGVVGLKTTWGRIPLDGVWPLAPSFDTVGPLARDVAGIVTAMALLDPAFDTSAMPAPAQTVARLRVPGVRPDIDDMVDAALREAELDIVDIELAGWDAAAAALFPIINAEAWGSDRPLVDGEAEPRIGADVLARLGYGRTVSPADVAKARADQQAWQHEITVAFTRVELLALPTLDDHPPTVEEAATSTRSMGTLTRPFNVAGTPAIALGNLQLVAPWHREDLLCATAAHVEEAIRGRVG